MLELSSVPSGANVTLDGEFQGQTPLTLEISPARKHRLAVFKPGYRRHNSSVELPAAGSDSQAIKLQAQLGEVRFQIIPGQCPGAYQWQAARPRQPDPVPAGR